MSQPSDDIPDLETHGHRAHARPRAKYGIGAAHQQWVIFHRPDEAEGLPALDEIEALRAENTVLRGHVQWARPPGISPVESVRLQERFEALRNHPAVKALRAEPPEINAI